MSFLIQYVTYSYLLSNKQRLIWTVKPNRFQYPRVLILDVWIEEIIQTLAALYVDMSMDIVLGIGGELLTDANVNILVTGMTTS